MVFTGDGKGKTTAALGCALRAAGTGRRTLMVQFIKGSFPTGEETSLAMFKGLVELRRFGRGYVFSNSPSHVVAESRKLVKLGLEYAAAKTGKGGYYFLILDEIFGAVKAGLISEKDVIKYLDRFDPKLNIILTGRGAGKALVLRADLVTEMKCLKHHYDNGVSEREGIEY